jgi:hypothetical protein
MLIEKTRFYQRKVESLRDDWESRIGIRAICLWVSYTTRESLGWGCGFLTSILFVLATFTGVPTGIRYSIIIVGLGMAVTLMVIGGVQVGLMRSEVMRRYGLPKRPGLSKYALRTPVEFDMWLIKTKACHRAARDSR